MLRAANLRCEYRTNPLGISTRLPHFSWQIESDGFNILQRSYEIEVATDSSFMVPVWQPGKLASSRSLHIRYGGAPLLSSTGYYWRVRVSDNQGGCSAWSQTAYFETAMLDNSEWKAAFITAEDEAAGESSAGTLFRKSFLVKKELKAARCYGTAKGIYYLFCNGEKAGDEVLAPGWTEYHKRLLYQTYDITGLLRPGENVIAAAVGPGWYKGDLASWLNRRNVYGSRTALLVQIRLEYQDGSVEEIFTDEAWKCAESPVRYSELYHGEQYDARLEQEGWKQLGFDDRLWRDAMLESRDVSQVVPADGLPVKTQETFQPVVLLTTPQGERVLDFGQNISGWVRFQVQGKVGERVVLRHAETLDAAGNFYTANLRSARQTVEYILKGDGVESYSPFFTFQGFRYVCVDEYPGEINKDRFTAVSICSDMQSVGEFACSHPLLNQLISNVRWSLKDNFVDIPTDCPQRDERLGWTGDAQAFARAACYLMESAPFYRKWMRDVAAAQFPNGAVTHTVPNVLQFGDLIESDIGATGWGDAITILPWTVYKYFGDRAILEEHYPAMKKWVAYIHGEAEDGLIWNSGTHFGDWLALDAKEGSYYGATPNDLTATAFYAYSVQILAKTAAVLGDADAQQTYEELHGKIVKAYQEEFFTSSGRLAVPTQTAHILSLVFDLTPERYVKRTIDSLVRLIQENDGHLSTGFLGTPYICQALSQHGYLDVAYNLLLKEDYPSWLYQVTKGATTIWEHWDGLKPDGTMWSTDMNSFNHYAYGAVADWIFSTIGGIDTSEDGPGFSGILLAPRPGGGLSWAKAVYKSGYGDIAVSWRLENDMISLDVSVAHNTKALLLLPGRHESLVCDRIEFMCKGEEVTAEMGSGTYHFAYPYEN